MFRKVIICVSLSIVMLGGCSSAQQKSSCAAAFYNLENLFDTKDDTANPGDDEFLPGGSFKYTETIYRQKLHNIARVLQQLGDNKTTDGPAIIGVAEVENKTVLNDLVQQPEIRHRNYRFVHYDSDDARGIDVALIYHPKYFSILNSKSFLIDLAAVSSDHRTRDMLYVCGILAGDTVHILVNHWPSRHGGANDTEPLRIAAARNARHIIDSLQKKSKQQKIILMGDLNDNPDNASVTTTLDATGNAASISSHTLFNPWLSVYQSGRGSLYYKQHWDLFDQVMLSAAWLQHQKGHLHYESEEVFKRDFLITRTGRFIGQPHRSFGGTRWINGYSDHLPVIIYFTKN